MRIFKILGFVFLIAVLYGLIFVPTEEMYYQCSYCGAVRIDIHYRILPNRRVYKNYQVKADHEHDFKETKLVVYSWLGLGKTVIDY